MCVTPTSIPYVNKMQSWHALLHTQPHARIYCVMSQFVKHFLHRQATMRDMYMYVWHVGLCS